MYKQSDKGQFLDYECSNSLIEASTVTICLQLCDESQYLDNE